MDTLTTKFKNKISVVIPLGNLTPYYNFTTKRALDIWLVKSEGFLLNMLKTLVFLQELLKSCGLDASLANLGCSAVLRIEEESKPGISQP